MATTPAAPAPRAQAMMTFSQLGWGVVAAIFAAVLLNAIVPVPVMIGAAMIVVLLLAQFVESRFGTGFSRVARLWNIVIAYAGGAVAFVVIRFALWWITGVAPIWSHDYWDVAGFGGFPASAGGIFWSRTIPSDQIFWEVLGLVVIVTLVRNHIAEKLGERIIGGFYTKIIAIMLLGTYLVLTAKVTFPAAYAYMQKEYILKHVPVEAGGLKPTIPTPAPAPAAKQAKASAYPICADTGEDIELDPVKNPRVELRISPTCWSGWVKLPWGVDFRVDNPARNGYEYLFWDGSRVLATEDGRMGHKLAHSQFRLRGHRGDAVVSIVVEGRAKS